MEAEEIVECVLLNFEIATSPWRELLVAARISFIQYNVRPGRELSCKVTMEVGRQAEASKL